MSNEKSVCSSILFWIIWRMITEREMANPPVESCMGVEIIHHDHPAPCHCPYHGRNRLVWLLTHQGRLLYDCAPGLHLLVTRQTAKTTCSSFMACPTPQFALSLLHQTLWVSHKCGIRPHGDPTVHVVSPSAPKLCRFKWKTGNWSVCM